MKKVKIISVLLAALVLCGCLVSCGGNANKQVNCTISVVVGGEYIVDHVSCPVKGESPVVLDALTMALDFLKIDYELGSTNLKRVIVDDVEYAEGRDASGENHWFWEYTVNGTVPEHGSAAANAIAEGDDIVFSFTSISVDDGNKADAESEDEGEPEAEVEGEADEKDVG